MCDPVSITLTTMAIAGGVKAWGQYQEGKANQKMYNYQSALAVQEAVAERKYTELQKKEISAAAAANVTLEQVAAADESRRLSQDVAELTGQQRATIGALGVGGGTTAAAIIASSFDKAQLDKTAIRYNANVKSWAIREKARRDILTLEEETKMRVSALESEAKGLRIAGKEARRAGGRRAIGTLLGTATQVATAKTKLTV